MTKLKKLTKLGFLDVNQIALLSCPSDYGMRNTTKSADCRLIKKGNFAVCVKCWLEEVEENE